MTENTLGNISKVVSVALSLSVFAGVATSCEGGSGVSDRDPDLQVCSHNWRTVYSPEQQPLGTVPSALGWHHDHLYTVAFEQLDDTLVSFPDVGGERTTLLRGNINSRKLWFEGGNVLFLSLAEPVTSFTGRTVLRSIPATGGPPQVLTTVLEDGERRLNIYGWAIDTEHVYWVEDPPGQNSMVWASPRTGGGARMLATLDGTDGVGLFRGIQPVGDQLLVYSDDGIGLDGPVFSVPRAGGEARRLPTAWQGARLMGVARDGTVLVQRQKTVGNGEPRSEQFETGRLRPGAHAVEPFWSGLPPTAIALRAWDDGAGGFYLHTWEWGPNDALHATMWALDSEGQSLRLACDPVVGSTISVAAVGPDGIYGIVTPGNTFRYWSVVKISR